MTNSCYFFRKIRDMRPNNDAGDDLRRRLIVLTGTRSKYFHCVVQRIESWNHVTVRRLANVMYSELSYENPENEMFNMRCFIHPSSEWECHYVNIWKSQGNNSPSPKWQAHKNRHLEVTIWSSMQNVRLANVMYSELPYENPENGMFNLRCFFFSQSFVHFLCKI
jgi:hypothetical protein